MSLQGLQRQEAVAFPDKALGEPFADLVAGRQEQEVLVFAEEFRVGGVAVG